MRSKWLYGLLLTAVFTVPTIAQVSLYIGTPPPALRYERRFSKGTSRELEGHGRENRAGGAPFLGPRRFGRARRRR
jgi:hypothetical protein